MQQTFSRKKPRGQHMGPREGQAEAKAASRSILSFLKPLGGGSSKAQGSKAAAAAAAVGAPASLQLSRPPQPPPQQQQLPAASMSKADSVFGFDMDSISGSSDGEYDEDACPAQRPAVAALQRKPAPAPAAVTRKPVAAVAARAKSMRSPARSPLAKTLPKPGAHALAASLQRLLHAPNSSEGADGSGSEGGPAVAARAVAAAACRSVGQQKQQREVVDLEEDKEEEEWDDSDEGEQPSSGSEGSEQPQGKPKRRQRQLKEGEESHSASDWAPDADSESEEGDSPEAAVPGCGRAAPAAKPATKPAVKQRKPAAEGAAPAAAAAAGRGTGGKKLAALSATIGAKRRLADADAPTKAAVAAAEGEVEDAVPSAEAAEGVRAKKGGARKFSRASSAALMLPAALVKTALAQRDCTLLLCELPPGGQCTNLDGDSGTIGRVEVPQPSEFLLDLKGIRYETELALLANTAALVRLKPSGDEAVVEELFPAVLRCQPGGDFLQENAELFREIEADDNERYALEEAEKEGGGGGGGGSKKGAGRGAAKGRGARGGGSKKKATKGRARAGAGKGSGAKGGVTKTAPARKRAAAAPKAKTAPKAKAAVAAIKPLKAAAEQDSNSSDFL